MKLYIHQAACSLSPHIVSRELELDVEIVQVDRGTHKTSDGRDFLAINPNGYVPVLVLKNDEIIVERIARYFVSHPFSDGSYSWRSTSKVARDVDEQR